MFTVQRAIGTPAVTSFRREEDPLLEVPADLRAWVGDWGLVQLALDAVSDAALERWRAGQEHSEGFPPSKGFPPSMMLTLLTFCYAAGIHASEDVELACQNSAQARYLCGHQFPPSESIRRFRRVHRRVLEACLARVLTEAWSCQRASAQMSPASELRSEASVDARIREQVQQRLRLGVIMDLAAEE